jgi:hypothetical protein
MTIPAFWLMVCSGAMAAAQEPSHGAHDVSSCRTPSDAANMESEFDGVQIETSDITLYEEFFHILHARLAQHVDHPQTDKIRGYCYRGVEIVVRQDLAKPRPTGWVQVNFAVQDVAALKDELEKAYAASPVSKREELERGKVIRFRLKPDVMRSNRKAIRLEVYGPEGFLIGFNQYK